MSQTDIEEVRAAYDSYRSNKEKRRSELRMEMERRLQEEDEAALAELSRLLHHKYNIGVTKRDLRWATRQYGSPLFTELWDAVPYAEPETRPEKSQKTEPDFLVGDGIVVFHRMTGDWNWSDVHEDSLMYDLKESENTGRLSLSWDPEDDNVEELARFNANNFAEIADALKGVEL